ncbi:MAG: transglycosylase SLT domain-containing protein [Pseudomonadales bacterium]|nr:transglycosylase SLT domain-containing protein [Pseudomonadales bacterium]
MMKFLRLVLASLFVGALVGCVSSPPKKIDNICSVFREKDDWHEDALEAAKKWGTEVPVLMAIMHQESKFVGDNKPAFEWFLIIPLGRASSAYGYAQALDETWDTYVRATGNWGADRDDFADAVDFIGWYSSESYRRNKIRRNDTYHLYLAYHEGHGGFERRSFRNKQWLKNIAKKVSGKSIAYRRQYAGCKDSLDSGGWFW